MLYLSDITLESLGIRTSDMVARIEQLLLGLVEGSVHSAPKSAIYPGDGRLFMSTLSSSEDPPYMAVKSLGMNPTNTQRNLKSIGAQIALFDSATGLPIAVMDGTWITAVRTAALTAVAATRLAKPDAAHITFVGCGVQACSHLDVLADLYPIKQITAVGRGKANVDALCARAQNRNIATTSSNDVTRAIAEADIVVTTVPFGPGFSPFLDAGVLKPDAFVSMVDLGRSWRPETLTAFDEVVIDDLEQEREIKSPMIDLSLVQCDLKSLVDRKINENSVDNGRRAFVFRGIALGDLALAGLCYEHAVSGGLGQILEP